MGCRDISVTLETVQDLWKKVSRKKKFGRVLPVASLSKQALSDTGGCHSSTCASEMPQRHFVFGSSRKFTAAICYLPIDSDAVVLDIYITLPQ